MTWLTGQCLRWLKVEVGPFSRIDAQLIDTNTMVWLLPTGIGAPGILANGLLPWRAGHGSRVSGRAVFQ